jgi:hypothetical protein
VVFKLPEFEYAYLVMESRLYSTNWILSCAKKETSLDVPDLLTALNKVGEQGWELVACDGSRYIVKRKKI